ENRFVKRFYRNASSWKGPSDRLRAIDLECQHRSMSALLALPSGSDAKCQPGKKLREIIEGWNRDVALYGGRPCARDYLEYILQAVFRTLIESRRNQSCQRQKAHLPRMEIHRPEDRRVQTGDLKQFLFESLQRPQIGMNAIGQTEARAALAEDLK